MKILRDLVTKCSELFNDLVGDNKPAPKPERREEQEEITVSGKEGDFREKVQNGGAPKKEAPANKKEAESKAESKKSEPKPKSQPKSKVESRVKAAKATTADKAKPKTKAKAAAKPKAKAATAKKAAPKKETLLSDTNLTASVKKALEVAGFKTVEELKKKSDEEILAIKGVGKGSLDKIKAL